MRRTIRRGALIVVAIACMPNASHAQIFRGTVRDRETTQPVWVSAVTLVDFFYKVRAVGMTDDDGRYELVAPGPGRYKVRADARGYASAYSGEYIVEPGDTVEVTMIVSRDAGAPAVGRRHSLNLGCVPPADDEGESPPDTCSGMWAVWVTNCFYQPITVYDGRGGEMVLIGEVAAHEFAVFYPQGTERPDITVQPHEDYHPADFRARSRGLITVSTFCYGR